VAFVGSRQNHCYLLLAFFLLLHCTRLPRTTVHTACLFA
jgi:hypothetical protein